jgi:TM2 domain-containing membrane protein YozV
VSNDVPPADQPYGELPGPREPYSGDAAGAYPPPPQGGYPPPPYGAPGYAGYGYAPGYEDPNAKSKLAAGLLGIFLGSLGIHRFYLGYTNIGLVMLLITVLTCGLGSVVTGIWGLVEGILYLTAAPGSKWSVDATNRPLRA